MESDYKTELEKNGVLAFVPSGVSMWPFLKHKHQSVIVLKKTERLKPLQVGLYHRSDDKYVLHRVIRQEDTGYIFCGDSQSHMEFVLEDQVIAVMTGFYKGKMYVEADDTRYLKKVKKWYTHKKRRKFILAIYFFTVKVRDKLKSMFCKKRYQEKDNND